MTMFFTRHISISINCRPKKVYEFVSNPENLPKWAAGLSSSIRQDGETWAADSPMGVVKVKFADNNPFGVLDHDVTLPSGVTVYNPMRVFPNQDGSELVFTLYRQPEMSDTEFTEDMQAIEQDLRTLKAILET